MAIAHMTYRPDELKRGDAIPCQVWCNLIQRFQRRRFKCDLLSKYA
jgi:hypothetical protein